MMITNPRLFVLQIRNNHVLIEIEFLFFPSIVHTALLSCLSQFNHDCYFSSIHPLAGSNYVRLLLDLPKFPISSQLVSSVIQDGPHFAVDSYLSREKFHHTRHVFFCLLLPLSRSFIRKRKSSDEPIVFVCVCVRFRRRPRFENIYIYIESPSLLPFLLYIVCACFRSFPCPAGYVRKKKKKLFHHDKSRNQGIKNISWVSCDGLNCPDMIVCREKKRGRIEKEEEKMGCNMDSISSCVSFFYSDEKKIGCSRRSCFCFASLCQSVSMRNVSPLPFMLFWWSSSYPELENDGKWSCSVFCFRVLLLRHFRLTLFCSARPSSSQCNR